MHSSSSSESEGDALEGNYSLENCSNSGATNNNHTNDAIEDEMTTMTFASSLLSTPLLSNNNHTNDIMAYAPTTTTHLSTSQFDLVHAVMTFDTNIAIKPPAKASFSSSHSTNSLSSKDNHTNDAMEDAMTGTEHSSTSQVDLAHAVMCFNTNFTVEPHAKPSFSSLSMSNPLPSNNNHTNDTMEDTMTTTAHLSTSQFNPTHAVMYSDDIVAVESPSTSQNPRQTHSIVHHELLLNNNVLFSVEVKTGGDDCGIIQLSAVAVNHKKTLENLTSTSSHCSMLNEVKQL